MAYRHKMSRGSSKHSFSNGARRIHRKNFSGTTICRGGIRL